ncbi:MAG: hypothetical protein WA888_20800 [Burkholderiaceae bacterium]
MSLFIAIVVLVLGLIVVRFVARKATQPQPPFWVSDNLCFFLIAPAVTVLFAVAGEQLVESFYGNPKFTAWVLGGLILVAIGYLIVGLKRGASAA